MDHVFVSSLPYDNFSVIWLTIFSARFFFVVVVVVTVLAKGVAL